MSDQLVIVPFKHIIFYAPNIESRLFIFNNKNSPVLAVDRKQV